MLTATLGGLIKDYRIKKRLSQLEVSLRIGWKDTSRLSKIEQGRVGIPTRTTLNRIMNALELNEQENNMMLLASRQLPSHAEIQQTIHKLKQKIESFETPVKLIDYSWRVFYLNSHAKKLYKTSDKINSYLFENKPNWLELLFSQDRFFGVNIREGYALQEISSYYEHEISQFKYDHMDNTKEKWYLDLIARLSKNETFRQKWVSITPDNYENLLYEHEVHSIRGEWNKKKATLNFHEFSVRPSFDFRYYLSIYMPADTFTYELYQRIKD